MVTGRPRISRKMPTKSSRWKGRSFASAAARPRASSARIISRIACDALLVEEHVLGAAEADALGAEGARRARVERRVGVRAHLHRSRRVGPRHELAELAAERRAHGRDRAVVDVAAAAVEGDDVALLERDVLGRAARVVVDGDRHRLRLVVHGHGAHAGDARLAHAARDDRRVARHPAARGEDAARGLHPVDVLRRRLDAHQDDRLALAGAALGLVGVEDDVAARGARARRRGRARGAASAPSGSSVG